MRASRALLAAVLLAGCNAILGIEEPERASSDGGIDAATDGTVADGTIDAPVATTDAGDAAIEGGEGGLDADAAGGFDAACLGLSTPIEMSNESSSVEGATVAFNGLEWGVAWAQTASDVRFNATDGGSVRYDGGIAIAARGPTYGANVRLASNGQDYYLVVGNFESPTKTYASFVQFGSGVLASDRTPDLANANAPQVAVLARSGEVAFLQRASDADAGSVASLYGINGPNVLKRLDYPATRAVAGTFLGGTAGISVAILNNTEGSLYSLLPDGGSDTRAFTQAGDVPVFPGAATEVSVTSIDATTAVVAWIGIPKNGTTTQVNLAKVTIGTNVVTSVTASTDPVIKDKYFPRIVWDGKSLVVAWIEIAQTGDYRIKLRRFDAALVPRDLPIDVQGALTKREGFGLAVGATPNVYGLAYRASPTSRRHFRIISCEGPP